MNVQNKVVVITGAGGGIGGALATLMAEHGAKVVVSDLDQQAALKVAEPISALAVQCDVSQEENIVSLIAAAEAEYGQIDLFCSNAGFGCGEPDHAASASNDVWNRNWQIHVMAHVYASRALLPKMLERGDGYLLNVASAAGLLSQISDAAYTATKHAAVAFAESLAIGHGDAGLKVSVVCPQYVNTNIIKSLDQKNDQMDASNLPGVISPEQCAVAILKGIEAEQFLITPHPEVRQYFQYRGADQQGWLASMRRLRAKLLDDEGKVDLSKIFEKVAK